MPIDIVEALGDLKEINLEISCRSGDVYAGTLIYNYGRIHRPKVLITVSGIAVSIASLVMMTNARQAFGPGRHHSNPHLIQC